MKQGEERREFQRLHLAPPIPATFGTTAVSILEIGVLGARVQHGAALEPRYADLRFGFGSDELALKCEVVRTFSNERPGYPDGGLASGLRFLAAIGESGDLLRSMLAQLVVREFRNQRLPAMPDPPVDGDKTVRGVDARFLSYRLEDGVWRRRRVFLPEQPQAGFTVASGEDGDEMQRLCAVYEASDHEGRRLIRLFAELSVSDVLEIPPRAAR
jgi:hypothetical protein